MTWESKRECKQRAQAASAAERRRAAAAAATSRRANPARAACCWRLLRRTRQRCPGPRSQPGLPPAPEPAAAAAGPGRPAGLSLGAPWRPEGFANGVPGSGQGCSPAAGVQPSPSPAGAQQAAERRSPALPLIPSCSFTVLIQLDSGTRPRAISCTPPSLSRPLPLSPASRAATPPPPPRVRRPMRSRAAPPAAAPPPTGDLAASPALPAGRAVQAGQTRSRQRRCQGCPWCHLRQTRGARPAAARRRRGGRPAGVRCGWQGPSRARWRRAKHTCGTCCAWVEGQARGEIEGWAGGVAAQGV